MARIIYREDFFGQRELFTNIKAKHDADAASSVLIPMLAEKGIDMTVDETNGNDAATHEASRALLSRQGENYKQLRDVKFDPVMKRVRSEVQFLKSFYKPNVATLGNWGVTVNGNKIVYPAPFNEQAQLYKDIKTKHDALAASSPLLAYITLHNIDMAVDLASVTTAEGHNTSMITTKEDAENETELRDNLWNPVEKHCHDIGDFLKKIYNTNPKALFAWGFVVDESPRPPKFRISKVKPASQTVTTGVVLGSTFTNLGSVDLHVYKGKTTVGTPAIVHPGEMLGMIKGYSVITVVNPSSLQTGIYKTLINR